MTEMSHDRNQFAGRNQDLDPQIEQYLHFALEEAGAKLVSATAEFDAGRFDRMSDELRDLLRLTSDAVESVMPAPEISWTQRVDEAAGTQRSP